MPCQYGRVSDSALLPIKVVKKQVLGSSLLMHYCCTTKFLLLIQSFSTKIQRLHSWAESIVLHSNRRKSQITVLNWLLKGFYFSCFNFVVASPKIDFEFSNSHWSWTGCNAKVFQRISTSLPRISDLFGILFSVASASVQTWYLLRLMREKLLLEVVYQVAFSHTSRS